MKKAKDKSEGKAKGGAMIGKIIFEIANPSIPKTDNIAFMLSTKKLAYLKYASSPKHSTMASAHHSFFVLGRSVRYIWRTI